MKKKIFLFLILLMFFITGCELSNNPTSKVEELLGKYQKLDDSIAIIYGDLSNEENLTNDQKDRYKKLIEKQYEDLSYEIKEEKIDGDNAVITTQIEVKNYKDIINKYSINNYDTNDYHNLLLDNLEDAKDKVTYTIDFKVIKVKDEWQVDDLDNEQKQKLLGLY